MNTHARNESFVWRAAAVSPGGWPFDPNHRPFSPPGGPGPVHTPPPPNNLLCCFSGDCLSLSFVFFPELFLTFESPLVAMRQSSVRTEIALCVRSFFFFFFLNLHVRFFFSISHATKWTSYFGEKVFMYHTVETLTYHIEAQKSRLCPSFCLCVRFADCRVSRECVWSPE